MIDCYRDPHDWQRWKGQRDNAVQQQYEDPCYFNGSLYATLLDRNVAMAKFQLMCALERDIRYHLFEISQGVQVGTRDSVFNAQGKCN